LKYSIGAFGFFYADPNSKTVDESKRSFLVISFVLSLIYAIASMSVVGNCIFNYAKPKALQPHKIVNIIL